VKREYSIGSREARRRTSRRHIGPMENCRHNKAFLFQVELFYLVGVEDVETVIVIDLGGVGRPLNEI